MSTLSTASLPPGTATLAHRETKHPSAPILGAPPSPSISMRTNPSATNPNDRASIYEKRGDIPPPIELDRRPGRSGSIAISQSSTTSAQPASLAGPPQTRIPGSAGPSQLDGTEPRIFPGVVSKHRRSSVQQRPSGMLGSEKDPATTSSPGLKVVSHREANQAKEPPGSGSI